MNDRLPVLQESLSHDSEPHGREAERKLQTLLEDLGPRVKGGALVAFSGGVDSAFLLWACVEAVRKGTGRVVALTTTSPSTPQRDREDAESFTKSLGVEHLWEESGEMDRPAYVSNDRDRCYHCKTELFRIARAVASREGLGSLLYGYNASDRSDHRPGHRAAREAGALTPLADAELTKPEIRLLMNEVGLPLGEKPASPCLSSRIMTGLEITTERLAHVQALEDILRDGGVSTHRVRICGSEDAEPFLRIEVSPEEMNAVLSCREALLRAGRDRGYRWVTLDLGGYRTGGGVR
jgi:uncharacterized protein